MKYILVAHSMAAGCLAVLAAAQPAPAYAQEVVTFAGWGGSIQRAQREIFFDTFEEKTGIRVIDVPDVQLPKIKAMVDTGNVQWDVVQSLGMWIPQGAHDNLWEPLDYDVISREGVPDALAGEYALGNSTYGIILAYNTNMAEEAPSGWADFWDVAGNPGRRGLYDGPRYSLEAALLADGVAPDDLYPLDVERAFASLDAIKDDIHVWWQQWPQVPVLLNSGELVMSLTSNTRIASAREQEGAPLDITWNGGMMTVDFLAVPRGAPNRDAAMQLINWMNDPVRQVELARIQGIGPANTLAFDELEPEEREALPLHYYNEGELVLFDNEWWAENEAAMIERWNAWKLQ